MSVLADFIDYICGYHRLAFSRKAVQASDPHSTLTIRTRLCRIDFIFTRAHSNRQTAKMGRLYDSFLLCADIWGVPMAAFAERPLRESY